jgi:hydroxymethylbilane synthase
VALAEGRAHLAVHSLKDVPMMLAPEFSLAAVMTREDPRDCFVSPRYDSLETMPAGSVVGTSSLRRELMLRAAFPKLDIRPVRGNVGTRLRKLDAGEFDALLMAAAGLKRLGLADRIRQILPTHQFLPAPGQGALGIECLEARADLVGQIAPLDHAATAQCVSAERAFSRALSGSCNVPLGAYAETEGAHIRLRGFVGAPDGSRLVSGEQKGSIKDAEALGTALADELKGQGAAEILAALQNP